MKIVVYFLYVYFFLYLFFISLLYFGNNWLLLSIFLSVFVLSYETLSFFRWQLGLGSILTLAKPLFDNQLFFRSEVNSRRRCLGCLMLCCCVICYFILVLSMLNVKPSAVRTSSSCDNLIRTNIVRKSINREVKDRVT
mgnify:CR=1 FL=1